MFITILMNKDIGFLPSCITNNVATVAKVVASTARMALKKANQLK